MANVKPISVSTILDPDNLNLAEFMTEDELVEMGSKLKLALETDQHSRVEWDKNIETAMKLALQYKEDKSFPWPNAANIKFPLVTTAALQFGARAYPNIVVGQSPVKVRVIGEETPELSKASAAIGKHMSYQLMEENQEWESEMDRMFVILPIVGISYKKTYFDAVDNRMRSQLILPNDLIVNYWAKTLDGYTRKHHLLEMDANDIYTRKEMEMFLDIDLPDPKTIAFTDSYPRRPTEEVKMPQVEDETTPYRIVECHCHWDLDKDGYREPYIVTFEYSSSTVLRVVPRFREDGVTFTSKGKKPRIIKVTPDEYFTKYGFIPNPDGSFYDIGFGRLLTPINESVNSAINQTLDHGTMYNTGGGFLGKGVRIKAGEYRLSPNEWKVVNATTDDLRKAIFPNPIKQPSDVSLRLAEMLIEGGNKVASIADIFVGKMPGQNTPATTTMETVKQSSAVFTAIYKRIYRSFNEELKKIYKLNSLYLDEQIDYPVELRRTDYKNVKLQVIPTADPDTATDSEKMTKAKALLEIMGLGTLDPKVVTRRLLEAMRVEDIDELMNYEKPPSPEQQQMQAEQQAEERQAQQDQALAQQDDQRKERDSQRKMTEGAQKSQQASQLAEVKKGEAQALAMTKVQGAAAIAKGKQQSQAQEGMQKAKLRALEGAQKYSINERLGKQKEEQMKRQAALKPKPKAK